MSSQPIQASSSSNDLFHLQQETILETHFQADSKDGGKTYSSEYVDSLFTKEFTNLTVQERSRTYEEIHGVGDCVDETSAFVEDCLKQLDDELSKITEKPAYYIAEQQNKEYVTDSKFRLIFLRATFFHPRKAAVRLVAFLEGKLRFFGRKTLTRQLRLGDLDSDDQTCLKAGHLQLLPTRDRSGRPIFVDLDTFHDPSFKVAANRLRACIFHFCMMTEDEENQKRGVVIVVMQMGAVDSSRVDPEMIRELPRLDKWMPIRTSALHVCTDHPVTRFLWRVMIMGTSHEARVRHRLHFGRYTEIKYSLMGYGIPVDAFPVSDGGVVKKTNFNRWISKHCSREETLLRTGTFSGVDIPTAKDILTGTGKPIQQHPGNVQLRALVTSYLEEYMESKLERRHAIDKVYALVKASSGRFLCQCDDGWWRETSEADAKDKVRSTFLTASWRQKKISVAARATKEENETQRSTFLGTTDMESSESSLFLPHGKKPRYDLSSCCNGNG